MWTCAEEEEEPAVVALAFNPSTWEAAAGTSLQDQGQPGLQSKCRACQGYTEKLFKEKKERVKGEEGIKGILWSCQLCPGPVHRCTGSSLPLVTLTSIGDAPSVP